MVWLRSVLVSRAFTRRGFCKHTYLSTMTGPFCGGPTLRHTAAVPTESVYLQKLVQPPQWPQS